MSRSCCAGTAGRRSGPPAARWSVTRARSPGGSARPGRRSQGAAKQSRRIVFLDESSLRLNPPVRRTWAPRGQTPVLVERRRNLPTLSMSALACYHLGDHGSDAQPRLLYAFREGSYDTCSLIRVLARLHRFLDHQPVTLVWDNLSAHRSHAMRAWTPAQDWLETVRLPGYAPDLNPVESVWSILKGCDLAGRAHRTIAEAIAAAIAAAQVGLLRIRRTPALLWSCLQHAGLDLTQPLHL